MSLREPNRMADEEIRQYVLDVLGNRVFTSGHMHPHENIGMVFMPLMMGAMSPPKFEAMEPPEKIPDDWTVEEFEEYPAKYERLKQIFEEEAEKQHKHYLEHIGGFWEFNSKALPRGINGLPCFMSVNVMHIEDWRRANKAIGREQERMKTLEC